MKTEELIQFGIINIDKPSGPTSYTVSDFLRRQLRIKKTSHMGTLDPKVTGVLPITLGRACRLAGYIIRHDKTYVGILQTHKEKEIKELQKLIDKHFTGKIKQTPPNKSAVRREERERTVHYFKIKEEKEKKRFLFETKVEGGTYIRKICSDLGEMIGGAHMAELRRTEAGIFDEKTLVTLHEFEEAINEYKDGKENKLRKMIMPAEKVIKKIMKTVEVEKRVIRALQNGKPLFKKDIITREKIGIEEHFAVFQGKQFVGVYKRTKEKSLYGRPEFVYA